MLKLKNVSKFYYNKGVIAAGFSKVSLQFEMGEFVAIVGESGSGKSTLLNVISGLDSYEEGEMYINGSETSHYRSDEFEEYRKKYVSNIFQHFNLVNSYTVYQNVELVLLLNGYKKRDVKNKVLEIIDRVRLSKYKNTKVSKLSGGQKQRVAIARALAKETPIIVCDEPTGNLDSKSAKEIIKILHEISKDKLVIVVTHNFSEIEDVATRVVKMHDGRVVSDKKIRDYNKRENIDKTDSKSIGFLNVCRLGVRNTFNIFSKFILMFIVFFFITVSLLTVYGSLRKSEYEESRFGYNWYFSDTSDTRIIIKKRDMSVITEDDIKKINKLDNVSYVFEDDIMLDNYLWFDSLSNEGFYLNGTFRDIGMFSGELDYGRMPDKDNEVVLLVNEYDYIFTDRLEDAVKEIYYLDGNKNNISISVVGVKYIDDAFSNQGNIIYGNSSLLDEYMMVINSYFSQVKININNKNYRSEDSFLFNVSVSDKVKRGYAVVSEDISYTCVDYNCKNKNIEIMVNNLYYKDKISLKVDNVYNSKNVNKILGINKDNNYYGSIFINSDDYDYLFNKGNYQVSVFADRVDYVDSLSSSLEELGYDVLQIRKTLNNDGADGEKIIKIVKLVVVFVLVITLFFISYFVIKLILKSRNVYFSILRILGANVKKIKRILDVELFINANLAYFTYVGFVLLVRNGILNINFIKNASDYLNILDYVYMYLILIVMSYLISCKFSLKIFKNSAMKSYREEV